MSSPFFIVGLGRSGTTLLRLMLNSHPRLAIPYEAHFLPKYIESLPSYGDLTDNENFRRLVGDILGEENIQRWDHRFEMNQVLEGAKSRTLASAIDAVYRDYARAKGKQRWGDKSSYMDEIGVISHLFENAQFVHIVRDGRDVAGSVLKQPWGPTDIIRAAEWWNDYVWVTRRMGIVLGERRYIEVRFEDLIADTEAELTRLCGFLGEEFDPCMLEFYATSRSLIPEDTKALHHNVNLPPLQNRAGAWKHEMNPCDVVLFSRYASRMLEELGYETSSVTVGRARMAAHLLKLGWRRWADR